MSKTLHSLGKTHPSVCEPLPQWLTHGGEGLTDIGECLTHGREELINREKGLTHQGDGLTHREEGKDEDRPVTPPTFMMALTAVMALSAAAPPVASASVSLSISPPPSP